MRVFDCFPFFNELELLEIRLHELNDIVDQFVLVEATRTHQKKEKPLVYSENSHLFRDFSHKIRHVIVDRYPGFFTRFRPVKNWDYERHQREMIIQGLGDITDEDRIIISDVDEIPSEKAVKSGLKQNKPVVFEQRFYSYYLNNLCTYFDTGGNTFIAQKTRDDTGFWHGSVMVSGKGLREIKSLNRVRKLRDYDDKRVHVEKDGGWHFTSVGDVERIITKIESYAHAEANTSEVKDADRIRKAIAEGCSIYPDNESRFRLIELTDNLPVYIAENPDKFRHMLKLQT